MVVFPFTHDRWSDGQPVDNHVRMQQNYTPENIRTAVLRQAPVGLEKPRT
jgi:hypothetical protein